MPCPRAARILPGFPNVSFFLTTRTLSFVFLLHAAEELAEVKRQDELDKGNKYVMAASKRLRNLVDLKKLDTALEYFHSVFEQHAPADDADAKVPSARALRRQARTGGKAPTTPRPDAITFNILVRISPRCRCCVYDQCVNVHRDLCVDCACGQLRGLVDAARPAAALDVCAWMRAKFGVVPTEVSWSLLAEGIALHGTTQQAACWCTLCLAAVCQPGLHCVCMLGVKY